jgi:hypothetical protein
MCLLNSGDIRAHPVKNEQAAHFAAANREMSTAEDTLAQSQPTSHAPRALTTLFYRSAEREDCADIMRWTKNKSIHR